MATTHCYRYLGLSHFCQQLHPDLILTHFQTMLFRVLGSSADFPTLVHNIENFMIIEIIDSTAAMDICVGQAWYSCRAAHFCCVSTPTTSWDLFEHKSKHKGPGESYSLKDMTSVQIIG